jgi:chromosome segregation ATPase
MAIKKKLSELDAEEAARRELMWQLENVQSSKASYAGVVQTLGAKIASLKVTLTALKRVRAEAEGIVPASGGFMSHMSTDSRGTRLRVHDARNTVIDVASSAIAEAETRLGEAEGQLILTTETIAKLEQSEARLEKEIEAADAARQAA